MVDTCCLPILTSNLKIFVLLESRKKCRLEMYTFGWCLLSDLLRIRVYVYPLLYHIGSEKPKKSMWSKKYRIAGTPILVSVKRKCAIWLASVKWSEELLKFRCGPSSVPHCKSLFCYWKPHKSIRVVYEKLLIGGVYLLLCTTLEIPVWLWWKEMGCRTSWKKLLQIIDDVKLPTTNQSNGQVVSGNIIFQAMRNIILPPIVQDTRLEQNTYMNSFDSNRVISEKNFIISYISHPAAIVFHGHHLGRWFEHKWTSTACSCNNLGRRIEHKWTSTACSCNNLGRRIEHKWTLTSIAPVISDVKIYIANQQEKQSDNKRSHSLWSYQLKFKLPSTYHYKSLFTVDPYYLYLK